MSDLTYGGITRNESIFTSSVKAEPLTLEDLQKTLRVLEEQADDIQYPMYVNALEYPFYIAIFNEHKDPVKVWQLRNECLRKYWMGIKRYIPKWSQANLIAQYTARLEQMQRCKL